MTGSGLASCVARGLALGLLSGAIAAPVAAGSADDDLQAVKRAVLASNASVPQVTPVPQARPPAEDRAPSRAESSRERGAGPKWFRVRVEEKGGRRGRVSVNLPIGFVRALGDEWPLPAYRGCRKRDRCGATLGEILRALDDGQSLVEIEDDEASVRVWID